MRSIQIPETVDVTIEDGTVTVSSGEQSLSRSYDTTRLDISVDEDTIYLQPLQSRKRAKSLTGTYAAHIQNMIAGVQEPYVYTLRIVNAHFPMTVEVRDGVLVIQNFLGERHNRFVQIPVDVDVNVNGDEITVSGPDKEQVGVTAGRIEGVCFKGSKDMRKFQDGIYLVKTNDE